MPRRVVVNTRVLVLLNLAYSTDTEATCLINSALNIIQDRVKAFDLSFVLN